MIRAAAPARPCAATPTRNGSWDELFARAPHRTRITRATWSPRIGAPDWCPTTCASSPSGGRTGSWRPALSLWSATSAVSAAGSLRPLLSPFVTATAPLVADGPDRARARRRPRGGSCRSLGWPGMALAAPADRGADRSGLVAAMDARGWRSARWRPSSVRSWIGVRPRGFPRRPSEQVALEGSAPPRPPAGRGRHGDVRDRDGRPGPGTLRRGLPRPGARRLEGRSRHRDGVPARDTSPWPARCSPKGTPR